MNVRWVTDIRMIVKIKHAAPYIDIIIIWIGIWWMLVVGTASWISLSPSSRMSLTCQPWSQQLNRMKRHICHPKTDIGCYLFVENRDGQHTDIAFTSNNIQIAAVALHRLRIHQLIMMCTSSIVDKATEHTRMDDEARRTRDIFLCTTRASSENWSPRKMDMAKWCATKTDVHFDRSIVCRRFSAVVAFYKHILYVYEYIRKILSIYLGDPGHIRYRLCAYPTEGTFYFYVECRPIAMFNIALLLSIVGSSVSQIEDARYHASSVSRCGPPFGNADRLQSLVRSNFMSAQAG